MMKVHAGNSRINGAALIYFFKLFVVLFGIWILLSGKFEVKFLAAVDRARDSLSVPAAADRRE